MLLACASALISTNWLIYIYAVNSGHVVDAALGYFINPLVSVLLGAAIFAERFNRTQGRRRRRRHRRGGAAGDRGGGSPVIATRPGPVVRALRRGQEGGCGRSAGQRRHGDGHRRPFALGYSAVLQVTGHSQFANHGAGHVALMLLCGPVTAIPLLFFAAAAQRLLLVTIGLLQYLTLSMQMTWGLVVGHEPTSATRWAGFGLIWLALAVFSADAFSRAYRARRGAEAGAS